MFQYKTRNHHNLKAFTLIELLVVITIISLLIAILLPALAAARGAARTMVCLSNQRQIGIGVFSFQTDHNGYYPPPTNNYHNGAFEPVVRDDTDPYGPSWNQRLVVGGYIGGSQTSNGSYSDRGYSDLFFCPDANVVASPWDSKARAFYNRRSSYGLNLCLFRKRTSWYPYDYVWNLPRATDIAGPGSTILTVDGGIFDSGNVNYNTPINTVYFSWHDWGSAATGLGVAVPRHNGVCNTLFNDGHASEVKAPGGMSDPSSIYDDNALTSKYTHGNMWDIVNIK